MTWPLFVARSLCGDAASAHFIEPLLADWQRELDSARPHGWYSVCAVTLSGFTAFARTLLTCAFSSGVWLPPLRGTLSALIAIVFSITIAAGMLMLAPLSANTDIPRSLSEPLMQRYLLTMSGTALPPAFLLALFGLRRDQRASVRHAALITAVITSSMTMLVVATSPEALERRYVTFEVQEHMRALSISSQRSGRPVYPGRRYQQELASTVAERRARFEQFRARMAEARRHDPPPSTTEQVARFQPVALSVVFAMMGWMLAGIGAPTIARGTAWWALVCAAVVTLTGLLRLLIQLPMPRAPQLLLPLFGAIAAALAWHSRARQHNGVNG